MQQVKQDSLTTLATAVSNVLSPPAVMAMVGFSLIAFPDIGVPPLVALGWSVLIGAVGSLIPVFYIVYLLKKGVIGDLHMARRQDRYRPFILGVLAPLTVWVLMAYFGAPQPYQRLALFDTVLFLLLGIINLLWQISTHSATIVGAVTIIAALFGTLIALLTCPLILLVIWARLRLKRHSIIQLAIGMLLGLGVALLTFVLL